MKGKKWRFPTGRGDERSRGLTSAVRTGPDTNPFTQVRRQLGERRASPRGKGPSHVLGPDVHTAHLFDFGHGHRVLLVPQKKSPLRMDHDVLPGLLQRVDVDTYPFP